MQIVKKEMAARAVSFYGTFQQIQLVIVRRLSVCAVFQAQKVFTALQLAATYLYQGRHERVQLYLIQHHYGYFVFVHVKLKKLDLVLS